METAETVVGNSTKNSHNAPDGHLHNPLCCHAQCSSCRSSQEFPVKASVDQVQ